MLAVEARRAIPIKIVEACCELSESVEGEVRSGNSNSFILAHDIEGIIRQRLTT